ncbi:helix-turn-helix domain-containing protein [Sphingomonas sp. GB1N7]|uniref:helix-turn-helix domain-containing protein n=1 Tax=Parasphingomonas caseinilytica TaxID=3096158 RepID=UPI002FC64D36
MDHDTSSAVSDLKLRQRGRRGGAPLGRPSAYQDVGLKVDKYRNVVFPNRIRQQRLLSGFPKLFSFCVKLDGIPYIRISKIERGEVFAKPEELRAIAEALEVAPKDLLLDVDATDFDMEVWFLPFAEGALLDTAQESEFAMLLAAAVRARRASDRNLTAAAMARDYAIPPVILSRLENAHKGLGRWNDQIVQSLCRLFGARDEIGMRTVVNEQHKKGELELFLADLPNAQSRHERTRERIAGLIKELDRPTSGQHQSPASSRAVAPIARHLPVFGSPTADGLIAMTPTGLQIEALAIAGSRSFGVRIGRASLGGGMPGHATVIVDPDRFPQAGGLALVKEEHGHRLLSVTIGKDGAMIGYSVAPAREVPLDGLAPEDVASVVAAIFI